MNCKIYLSLMLVFLMSLQTFSQIANHVVISEIYGGGGNSEAQFRYDFVEIYNPTLDTIDISGWSVQYSSATGSSWTVNSFGSSKLIMPRCYFLIQLGSGGSNGDTLPTPDVIGTSNLSASAGKIALVSTTTPLSGTNPQDTSIIDLIGYGSTANGYEGSGPAPGGNNTNSIERKAHSISTSESMAIGGIDEFNGNAWDSNNNVNDIVQRPGPQPQNSVSASEIPPSVNQPPIITSLYRRIFVPSVNTPDTIFVNITDDGNITSAKLHVSVNRGNYDSSVSMINISGSTYYGIISANKHQTNGDLIEYFVSATDDSSYYSSTENSLQGYFVGNTQISAIKSYLPAVIKNYAAVVSGTLNSNTNLFTSNSGYLQDNSGGLHFRTVNMPNLSQGKNIKIGGTINEYKGGYVLTDPNFTFVDTNFGTSPVIPVTIELPLIQSPSNVNEGKVVRIQSLSTDSQGVFVSGKIYLFKNYAMDTISVKVESNGSSNTLVGKNIPDTSIDITGILAFDGSYLVLKPRNSSDMGISEGDGSGTATIIPTNRMINISSVSETLTVVGDGVHNLEGVEITIPHTWTWTGILSDVAMSGSGYGSAIISIHGDGTMSNPWEIVITGATVTNTNSGTLVINNLSTPSISEISVFNIKTRISGGAFTNISNFPVVIVSANTFEAVATGNWSDPAIWSGGIVPGRSDNVTMTTPDIVVTIDNNAECRDLILSGVDTVGGHLGPVLQFKATGNASLTINGKLELSGGIGGGGGSRGGKPKLTSNGNAQSELIVYGNIFTNVSNTVDRDNAGLNMNEGTVRLIGSTSDTLKNGAGLRLSNLIIGDGINPKVITWISTSSATLNIRSLTIKSGSTMKCGGTNYSTTNAIGNSSNNGLPMLTGGIKIEYNANFVVNNAPGGSNSSFINIKDGGIINNGSFNLRSPNGTRMYHVSFGDLSADPGGSKQIIGGSSVGNYNYVKVGQPDTIILNQNMILSDTMLLKGELVEVNDKSVLGTIKTSRVIKQGIEDRCGGIGVYINALNGAPDTTFIQRTTGIPSAGGGNQSILRYFLVEPRNNSNLNSNFIFKYSINELNGHNASTLGLWRSTNGGITWQFAGGVVDTLNHEIMVTGIESFSKWTASDATHPLGSQGKEFFVNTGWNMISVPLRVPDYRKLVLYPSSVSEAFEYCGVYEARDTLINGKGYWLKFSTNETVSITGDEYYSDTIEVGEGWNMIGCLSKQISTKSIYENPAGIIESQFYTYNGTYRAVDTLIPGTGYWVKTSSAGDLILDTIQNNIGPLHINQIENLNKIKFSDARGFSTELYFCHENSFKNPIFPRDLPPKPPTEAFDVRFKSNRILEVFRNSQNSFAIETQAMVFPVNIEWEIDQSDSNSYFLHLDDGENIQLSKYGKKILYRNKLNDVTLYSGNNLISPTHFSINKNYPNPFNPETRFTVEIPYIEEVEISIYNILGEKVFTIFHGILQPGFHDFAWDGMSENGVRLPSGLYFLMLKSKTISVAHKVILLK